MSWLCAVRWPWREDRYSGLQPIVCIIRTPIKRATPILPTMVVFGPIWAGFSPVRPCKRIQRSSLPYVPELRKDRFHMWISRWHWVPITLLAGLLFAVGGWRYVLWGIFLRTVIGLHSTWLVNSATHMWGRRRFRTRDDSRNSFWVALLTFGEGWHNNHHAYPQSARHGMAWYEFDPNWYGILVLRILGLAWDVKAQKLNRGNAK